MFMAEHTHTRNSAPVTLPDLSHARGKCQRFLSAAGHVANLAAASCLLLSASGCMDRLAGSAASVPVAALAGVRMEEVTVVRCENGAVWQHGLWRAA